jgi:AcrR family transcriptional regulator
MDRFFAYGFSRVTMEEIASGLGISKRTLYRYVDNKLELFERALDEFFVQTSTATDSIMTKKTPYDVKLALFLDVIGRQMSRLNFEFVRDAKQNAPEAWDLIVSVRRKGIETNFAKLINEGRRKGLVQGRYDDKLILDVFLGALERVTSSEAVFHTNISMKEATLLVVTMLLNGIVRTPHSSSKPARRVAS